jgi:hypothetical protein
LIWFKKFKEFQEGVNMTEAGFNEWLEVYGKGWMSKSPDLFLSIFSPDATYAHSPFHREMKGHDDIRQYAERAFIYQEAACSLCMDTRFRPDTGQSSDNWIFAEASLLALCAVWHEEYRGAVVPSVKS